MSDYLQQNYTVNNFSDSNNWVLLNSIESSIKEKIENNGVPGEWDIAINYGIKTGYNDAFIIDEATKNTLIAADPKSAELIRPILRGKDIKRYTYNFANLWLIYIPWHFPLQNDPSIKGASKKAETEFKKQYPAMYSYLETHKEKLSKRNKAETGIRYEWYALQRWGSNYWDDFNKQKLVWTPVNSEYKFSIVPEGYYFNNSIFMITGNNLLYLCGILNSKLYQNYFRMMFTNGNYNYGSAASIKKIPIIKLPKKPYKEIESIVKKILSENNNELSSQIDLVISSYL